MVKFLPILAANVLRDFIIVLHSDQAKAAIGQFKIEVLIS